MSEPAKVVHMIVHRPDLMAAAPYTAVPADKVPRSSPGSPAEGTSAFPIDGRALWADLHVRALVTQHDDDDSAYLHRFEAQLPCGHCRAHWAAMLRDHPPVYTVAGYFAWTVDRHNDVNRKLGKPVLTQNQARGIWQDAL